MDQDGISTIENQIPRFLSAPWGKGKNPLDGYNLSIYGYIHLELRAPRR